MSRPSRNRKYGWRSAHRPLGATKTRDAEIRRLARVEHLGPLSIAVRLNASTHIVRKVLGLPPLPETLLGGLDEVML